MKVALITGSLPPEPCGVGSYTQSLAEALRTQGVAVDLLHMVGWSMRHLRAHLAAVRRSAADVIHLQYPTQGFRRYLAPLLLPGLLRGQKVVTTLHEFSREPRKGKLKLAPLGFSDHLIFTTEFERDAYVHMEGWTRRKSSVIPIGSSIPRPLRSLERDPFRVVYFGLLLPGKGLEQFIELVRRSKASARPWNFALIGSIPPEYRAYGEAVRDEAQSLGVSLHLERSNEEVAGLLSEATWAYLPFPDGPSERRTTLISSLQSGLNVLTPPGLYAPRALESTLWFAPTPAEALETLERAGYGRGQELRRRAEQGFAYSKRFSWNYIALEHLHVYSHARS